MVWSPNHQNLSKVQLQSQLLQLRNWVAQLPDALIQARPRLLLAQGWVLALLGQLTAAEKLLTNSPLQSPDLAADIYFALAGFVILTGLKNHKSCPTAV